MTSAAAQRHVARRTSGASALVEPAAGAAAAMRIGALGASNDPAAAVAFGSPQASSPIVRQGLTPAGGLTVELGDRFTTRMVVHARGATHGTQCSADSGTVRRVSAAMSEAPPDAR